MKHGKFICNQLKQVRLDIARANGIKYVPRECHHEGDCEGTCPACESEMRYLEREIARKRSMGKVALIAGVSLGLTSLTTTSCDYVRETVRELSHHGHDGPLEGEVVATDPETDSLNAEAYTIHSDKNFIDVGYGMEPKAVFPGGEGALLKFIKQNFVCPEHVDSSTFTIVEVVIDSEGVPQEPYMPYVTDSAFCAEALRVTNLLPKFEPAQDEEGNNSLSRYYILFKASSLKPAE